jgi:GT2 family glycosyltransferase
LFRKAFFLTQEGRGNIKPSGFPAHCNGDSPAFVEVLSGALMAYRREAFGNAEFDTKLIRYAYMEDVDFSYRISRYFRLFYQPLACAEHHATTYQTADSRNLRRMMIRNHSYLFRKNLPQDLYHQFAHYISIAGTFLYNLIFQKDLKACLGVLEGFISSTIMKKGPSDDAEQ